MNAQLAGDFQIIVYAGAIMVLFLFVIMLLNVGRHAPPMERHKTVRVLGLVFAAALAAQMIALVGRFAGDARLATEYRLSDPPDIDIATVGRILQTDYIYAFAMTSVLLLVAMIGAVVMARRHLIQGIYDESKDVKMQTRNAER
jgi:NADH:ubiquinone oxidoreductase subunit 6 (subunit J)